MSDVVCILYVEVERVVDRDIDSAQYFNRDGRSRITENREVTDGDRLHVREVSVVSYERDVLSRAIAPDLESFARVVDRTPICEVGATLALSIVLVVGALANEDSVVPEQVLCVCSLGLVLEDDHRVHCCALL